MQEQYFSIFVAPDGNSKTDKCNSLYDGISFLLKNQLMYNGYIESSVIKVKNNEEYIVVLFRKIK